MQKTFFLFAVALLISFSKAFGTTWDEPWADKVIKEASSFILAKVISCDAQKGITIEVTKTLGGNKLSGILTITAFSHLTICSYSSGEGPEFHTSKIDSCYFFISQNKEGKYCIATPTTGFDYVADGEVVATYRHSYHQASVPVSIYEKTMTAIFNNYHSLPYDKPFITDFVTRYLSMAPAGFSKGEINIFFLQHVALECVHHLKLNINEHLVLPFLTGKNNFHSQVSAARAMVAFNTNTSKEELLKIIGDSTQRSFVQVMCILSIAEFNPKEMKAQLTTLANKASDESDGFGGNIMDPRVCTSIPSVKAALLDLCTKL